MHDEDQFLAACVSEYGHATGSQQEAAPLHPALSLCGIGELGGFMFRQVLQQLETICIVRPQAGSTKGTFVSDASSLEVEDIQTIRGYGVMPTP
ncbi:MAG: hypothetical protein Q7J36_02985 [Thiobacillus sp.]|nr:hypothetical protein [Thiobacillus sp.]